MTTKVQRLEAQVEYWRNAAEHRESQTHYWKTLYDDVVKAWSRVHPADLAYMRSMAGKTEFLDTYNQLIYAFGRPDKNGIVMTRLESVYHWPTWEERPTADPNSPRMTIL